MDRPLLLLRPRRRAVNEKRGGSGDPLQGVGGCPTLREEADVRWHTMCLSSDALEQCIDDYSRDRDIQPNRKSPSRDAPVELELTAKPKPKASQDERQRHHRKPHMADQYEKVDRADPTAAWKPGIAMEVVIDDIRHQKQCREHRCGQHEPLVCDSISTADVDVPKYQAQRAHGIERCVGGGER